MPELHRRAYAWHRASGTTDEAIHHALAAGAFAEAGELIAETLGRPRQPGPHLVGARVARPLPRRRARRRRRGCCSSRRGRRRCAAARPTCALPSHACARSAVWRPGPLPDGFSSLEASVSVLSAAFAWGDAGAVLAEGARSAELEGPDSPWRPVVSLVARAGRTTAAASSTRRRAGSRRRRRSPRGPTSGSSASARSPTCRSSPGCAGGGPSSSASPPRRSRLARERGLLEAIEVGRGPHRARRRAGRSRPPRGGARRARAGRLPAPPVGAAARPRRRAGRARAGGRGRRRPRRAPRSSADEAEALLGGCRDAGRAPSPAGRGAAHRRVRPAAATPR